MRGGRAGYGALSLGMRHLSRRYAALGFEELAEGATGSLKNQTILITGATE